MGREDPRFLVVGHLTKPHGIKGDLFVSPLTDHPGSAFAPGVVLLLGLPEGDQPDPDLPPLRVESARPFRRGWLVSFGGVDDRNQADLLRGRYLYRPAEEVEPLAEGEIFYHQLLGMHVVTVGGDDVGCVTEVYELAPRHLLEVTGDGAQRLIPFSDEVVVQVDADERTLVIDPPPGLLDL
jgi:16S rRNA processing protein RimM